MVSTPETWSQRHFSGTDEPLNPGIDSWRSQRLWYNIHCGEEASTPLWSRCVNSTVESTLRNGANIWTIFRHRTLLALFVSGRQQRLFLLDVPQRGRRHMLRDMPSRIPPQVHTARGFSNGRLGVSRVCPHHDCRKHGNKVRCKGRTRNFCQACQCSQ